MSSLTLTLYFSNSLLFRPLTNIHFNIVFLPFYSDETEKTAENNHLDSRIKNTDDKTEKRLKEIAKKIKGDGKWRWKGKGRISKQDREEQNKKRRVMKHFRGAKSDKISKLSSSRLLAYGVNKKKKSK
jgi:hypothetical protein